MSTSTDAVPSLKRAAFGDFEQELAQSRRVLERIPDQHFAWKPHEKSGSLGQLSGHVAGLPDLALMVLTRDGLDVLGDRPRREPATTRDELLARFDESAATARAALEAADEATFAQPWTLRAGERVVFTAPRAGALRTFFLSHLIHHRAQLTVYLRLLNVPVPGMYGPSADDPGPLG